MHNNRLNEAKTELETQARAREVQKATADNEFWRWISILYEQVNAGRRFPDRVLMPGGVAHNLPSTGPEHA